MVLGNAREHPHDHSADNTGTDSQEKERLNGGAGTICGKLFDALDVDDSGFLEKDEAMEYLRIQGTQENELEYYHTDLLRCADTNNDGKISKSEFVEYVLQNEELDDNGDFEDSAHRERLLRELSKRTAAKTAPVLEKINPDALPMQMQEEAEEEPMFLEMAPEPE